VKKLLIIFLLVLIPLQYSWAAVAVYCQHEKEETTHVGHHKHEHAGKAQQADADSALSAPHDDCSYCHQACQAPLAPSATTLSQVIEKLSFASVPALYESHIPEGPERPSWLLHV